LAVNLALLVAPSIVTAGTPSQEFWNPFRNSTVSVYSAINDTIDSILSEINKITGTTVSLFRVPQPSQNSLYKTAPSYNPNLKSVYPSASPDTSVQDTSGTGTPCSGQAGSPFWANDCSCHCSTGGLPNTRYEVGDRCPEDNNLSCEDCRKITRDDNTQTTIEECWHSF